MKLQNSSMPLKTVDVSISRPRSLAQVHPFNYRKQPNDQQGSVIPVDTVFFAGKSTANEVGRAYVMIASKEHGRKPVAATVVMTQERSFGEIQLFEGIHQGDVKEDELLGEISYTQSDKRINIHSLEKTEKGEGFGKVGTALMLPIIECAVSQGKVLELYAGDSGRSPIPFYFKLGLRPKDVSYARHQRILSAVFQAEKKKKEKGQDLARTGWNGIRLYLSPQHQEVWKQYFEEEGELLVRHPDPSHIQSVAYPSPEAWPVPDPKDFPDKDDDIPLWREYIDPKDWILPIGILALSGGIRVYQYLQNRKKHPESD